MEKEQREFGPLARSERRTNEILGLVLLALSVWIMYDLIAYIRGGFLAGKVVAEGEKVWAAGFLGHQLAEEMFAFMGPSCLVLPPLLFLWGWNRLRAQRMRKLAFKTVTVLLVILLFSAVCGLLQAEQSMRLYRLSGWLGLTLAPQVLIPYFGQVGSWILVITTFLLMLILSTHIRLSRFRVSVPKPGKKKTKRVKTPEVATTKRQKVAVPLQIEFPKPQIVEPEGEGEEAESESFLLPERELEMFYQRPSVSLLDRAPNQKNYQSREELLRNAEKLEVSLANFQVEGKVVQVSPGPIVTRYELKPAPGVKVNRIISLADDLAMAMKARRIRILAPIPGKDSVGIEIPNSKPSVVRLREILESERFQASRSKLTLALGKTISGEPYCADLTLMPHLLIAGATGSGKSVAIHSMVTSVLFKATPEEVRFIMVDPKMLELSVYNEIPHLLTPVVTETKKASEVLRWAVAQMEDRYRNLAQIRVRNIDEYNRKLARSESSEEGLTPLPYIVVVIDELADLMLLSNEIEQSLVRLAQMARAVGIHLILATQRPSVDVITGLIKANFPSRIALQVASKVDSRTILDANGAEKLLGNGDMLFLPVGQSEPVRIHGAYISREETERLVEFLKQHRSQESPQLPEREIPIQGEPEIDHEQDSQGRDKLFDEAMRLVILHQQGSISLLQRRLKIGYARAARLIDQLEAAGIVGPFDGSKAREVLVDETYLEKKLGENYTE